MKDFVTINDREFISVKRASEITKYTKDYVGQLCREGKVAARMIGRTWFIDHESILNYKKTTDDQFFVNYGKQKETPILQNAPIASEDRSLPTACSSDVATYVADNRPLLPVLDKAVYTAVARTRARVRSVSWPASRFFRNTMAVVILMAFISGSVALFMGSSLSGTNLIAVQTDSTASVASPVENIFSGETLSVHDGVVIVPSTDSIGDDVARRQKIQESFSDEVEVRPDESGTAGIVTPVFKDTKGESFMYVLVPVQEQEQEQGP
jgi:hypothetical protein